jgi:hypothetical protein
MTVAAVTALIAVAMVCPAGAAKAQQTKKLWAHPRGDDEIVIDGRLDEPVWSRAPVADDFVERLPRPLAEPPVKTEVRVLYDRDAIYVGVRCGLLQGEEPRADTLSRDSTRLWYDEAVTIKFDVHHDRRNTVGVALNPAGTQVDYLAVENGRVFRVEYDAVWESETFLGDGFWSAEVRLPVAALGLPPVEGERVIGFNIARDHNSRWADYDWSHLAPEFGPWSAVHYGELHGVRDIAAGQPFMLMPYLLVGYPPPDPVEIVDLPLRAKAGGDARLRVADSTWTELTLFTDFAQVEVDDQVVNLDRYPLFFPERRPFFLTGLEVFDFGEPEVAQLFHSRRIGLDADREPVPVLGGFKLYGNSGVFEYGLLDVVTDDTYRRSLDDDGLLVENGLRGANFALGRVRSNLGKPGHLGFLLGSRHFLQLPFRQEQQPFAVEPHFTFGVDGLTRTLCKRLELSGFGAVTHSEQLPETRQELLSKIEQGQAAQGQIRYLGEVLQPKLTSLFVSEKFDPQIGYVRKKGVWRNGAELPVVWRTWEIGLQSITFTPALTYEHTEQLDALLQREGKGMVAVQWASGWGVELEGRHLVDVVQEDFELLPDITIPAGHYRGPAGRGKLISPVARNPGFDLQYDINDAFFGGTSHTLTGNASLYLGPHLRLGAGSILAFLLLPDHPLQRTLALNSGVGVLPSTRLSQDLIFQLNTVTRQMVAQARLRWRYLPGSDLFIVYQETISYQDPDQLSSERSFTLKASYRYDTVL